MTEFDKLWNYNNPLETEQKFREALNSLSFESAPSVYIQLETQLARTLGLQKKFTDAHQVLDSTEARLGDDAGVEHIRYFLERGRVYNTSGDKRNASLNFHQSLEMANRLEQDFYAIDAMHMLAIAATPDVAIQLNEAAIVRAESSTSEQAKDWLGSLYNNLGWSYFDKGQHEKALSVFLRALQWREQKQQLQAIFLAKWCVARTLRALNRLEEAITIQLGLFEELTNNEQKDGYVYEELAELYLAQNNPVNKMYFQFAYQELSTDTWLCNNEPARIERLKQFAS